MTHFRLCLLETQVRVALAHFDMLDSDSGRHGAVNSQSLACPDSRIVLGSMVLLAVFVLDLQPGQVPPEGCHAHI